MLTAIGSGRSLSSLFACTFGVDDNIGGHARLDSLFDPIGEKQTIEILL